MFSSCFLLLHWASLQHGANFHILTTTLLFMIAFAYQIAFHMACLAQPFCGFGRVGLGSEMTSATKIRTRLEKITEASWTVNIERGVSET